MLPPELDGGSATFCSAPGVLDFFEDRLVDSVDDDEEVEDDEDEDVVVFVGLVD